MESYLISVETGQEIAVEVEWVDVTRGLKQFVYIMGIANSPLLLS